MLKNVSTLYHYPAIGLYHFSTKKTNIAMIRFMRSNEIHNRFKTFRNTSEIHSSVAFILKFGILFVHFSSNSTHQTCYIGFITFLKTSRKLQFGSILKHGWIACKTSKVHKIPSRTTLRKCC